MLVNETLELSIRLPTIFYLLIYFKKFSYPKFFTPEAFIWNLDAASLQAYQQ